MPAKPYPNCMFFRGDKMALDFVAMDFETANEKRASACAVALVFFEDGRVSKQYEWFIRPPHHLDYFNPFNTQIHGITASPVPVSHTLIEARKIKPPKTFLLVNMLH
jgi:DNA polymerase III epsilon subunit-like protein